VRVQSGRWLQAAKRKKKKSGEGKNGPKEHMRYKKTLARANMRKKRKEGDHGTKKYLSRAQRSRFRRNSAKAKR